MAPLTTIVVDPPPSRLKASDTPMEARKAAISSNVIPRLEAAGVRLLRPGDLSPQQAARLADERKSEAARICLRIDQNGSQWSIFNCGKIVVSVCAGRSSGNVNIAGGIKSNMQGMVLKVSVSRGAAVKKGDTLLVLEAMKMENPIHSPIDGKVVEIFVDTGDVVQSGDVLLVVQ